MQTQKQLEPYCFDWSFAMGALL